MKIAQQRPDLLVLTDVGAPLRAVGAILLVCGAVWSFLGAQSGHLPIGQYVIAAILGVAGAALIILPARVTAAFDLAQRTLVITRRTLRGTTRDEVDFSKIANVEAEASAPLRPGGASPGTWRLTIVLRDGTRLPLTSYYSNSPTYAASAAAARAFLNLHEPPSPLPASPPSVAPAPTAAAPAPSAKPNPFAIAIFATAFLGLFVALGVRLNYLQYHRLATYHSVPAVVLFVSVEEHHGTGRNTGTTYSPNVTYRYRVGDRDYVSARVTPLTESRSGHWAANIAARYHPGDSVLAYYDPAHPDQAFLLHQLSVLPSFFMLFPFVLIALFVLFSLRSRRRAAMASPLSSSSQLL